MRIFRGILILITSVLLLACGGYYGEGYYGRPYPGYYPGHFYRHHLHDRGRLDSRHDVNDGKIHHHGLREDHHDGPGVHHLHNGKATTTT